MADLFDPAIEEQAIILLDYPTIHRAEKLIIGCEGCSPAESQIALDYLLDQLTGRNPIVTHYLLREPAICPRCRRAITEKTLIAC